jgi:hypothetical protein
MYGPICAATRRAGANFPHFIVARRSKILHIRRSSLLELRKIGSRRCLRESEWQALKVSPETTAASKVTMRRLTHSPTGATLAIPDLVHNSNSPMRGASRKLDPGLPRVVWLPSQYAACIQAPCRDACRRNWSRKRPAVVHAASIPDHLIADHLITNTPVKASWGRCRTIYTTARGYINRPGGR